MFEIGETTKSEVQTKLDKPAKTTRRQSESDPIAETEKQRIFCTVILRRIHLPAARTAGRLLLGAEARLRNRGLHIRTV